MKKGSLLVLPFVVLVVGFVYLRSRPKSEETAQPGSVSPSTTSALSSKGPPTTPSAVQKGVSRSRAQLVAQTRKRIRETDLHWSIPWAKARRFDPPLPRQAEFWALVEALKKDLGDDAAAVLSDLIDDAVAARTEQLYTALLAALKDPNAEARLAQLATSDAKDLRIRGFALYGLGLLKSDSAWKSALEAWEKDTTNGRSIFYPGMGLFGERAFPLLLKEAERNIEWGNAWTTLANLEGPEVRGRLWDLVETSKSDDVRSGALAALCRNPDAETVARLLDLVEHPDRPSGIKADVKGRLVSLFASEGYSLQNEPRLRDQILARWDALSPELRWALCCDPEIRRSKPNAIDSLPPPESFKFTYLYALANDPARHAQMVDYIQAHIKERGLLWTVGALNKQPDLSDPSLQALLRTEALRLPEEGTGEKGWAWQILSQGPVENRAAALADVSVQYDRLSKDSDRLRAVTDLTCAGPDSVPVALDLLKRATSPLVRFDLLSTALFHPGHEGEARAVAAGEIDQILSGATSLGMEYIAAHPDGKREGLRRYAEAVRNVFSAYGTPEDIPRIRGYFSTLVIPASLSTGEEALDDEDAREQLSAEILESIDAIRARH